MRSERYQIALISLGVVVTALFGYFFYKEMFPEYKIYQSDYVALEEFRSTYTGESPPAFKMGVKQIVFEREDKGPAAIDRCTSCHVALQLPHFSPTIIARDDKGQIILDDEGNPVQIANKNDVWFKLNEKIAELRDEKVNQQLSEQGNSYQVASRLAEADKLEALKTAKVGEHIYDVTKVLRMHPLIGKETRPFEFHPIDDYGCTSCHSGNGRGLTTDKAHGPVLDGFYEEEFTGHTPNFTEHDDDNDPRFAKIFNHKPGHDLLFQTTPILLGSLIQAKCVQCHKSAPLEVEKSSSTVPNKPSDVDLLTKDYHRGQQLFISQGCYACHRIAGFARGGIGPELTKSGDTYPWFLKESMVWPQADLKTSTMPNYKLDSEELEDLMTFLLAQKGPSKAVSEIDYKVGIQQWEAGKKIDLEQPVPPSKIRDLRYSMTVFATQGCAACHRLEGFDSNIGFAVEKEKTSDFDKIYKEKEWFHNLFPEEIRGTDIVKAIDENQNIIDERIVENVRQNSLLEEIEAKYPETLESFYSTFRFASRAKNHAYATKIAAENSPEKKQLLESEPISWKKRVHRILMVYIQEYGLGRLIGPKPNWSGVYRSDQWLMEHFRNPARSVPRSIMPIFPFDDSKFYALTYMLDALGVRNRDHVAQIWQKNGFDPELAYKIHCSQCHGDFLQGNGPVATWIYPIPKNLRNAEFMRNLTKEKAIQSIVHGVKGTPMAPWGETPKDKITYDGKPVLTVREIEKLVDWLYASIPGGTVIRGKEDVPRWNYTPADVIDELNREGSKLEPASPESKYFDVKPNPLSGGNKDLFYIKKKYYTAENLEQGRNFYQLNCAVCHGSDADGAGARAAIMNDAKPRMLNNFDWIDTRDDLRLLGSIKYGVTGTSMTPWGDFTSSKQRMQLVMYIRSLTFDKKARDELTEVLYNAFVIPTIELESYRVKQYEQVASLDKQLEEINNKHAAAEKALDVPLALELYQKQFKVSAELKEAEQRDRDLVSVKVNIEKQLEKLQAIGNALLNGGLSDSELWPLFLDMVKTSMPQLKFEDGRASVQVDEKQNALIADYRKQIDQVIEQRIAELENDQKVLKGKLPSREVEDEKEELSAQLAVYNRVKQALLSK